VVERIANLKNRSPQSSDLEIGKHLKGVDIPQIEAKKVELIIVGVDPHFHKQYEIKEGGSASFWAVKTLLSWTLFGRSRVGSENIKSTDSLEETHVQLLLSDEIETARNPADLFSRGVHPSQVHKAAIWLQGPRFLLENKKAWPERSVESVEDSSFEHEHVNVVASNCERVDVSQAGDRTFGCDGPLFQLANRFSSLHQTVKATAWLLRVKAWLRTKSKARKDGFPVEVTPMSREAIDGEEYEIAFMALMRLAQQQAHPGLVESLELYPTLEVFSPKGPFKGPVPPIANYCPFVVDGVIRIGGRLVRAEASIDFRHLIVLPQRHHVTGLVVDDAHRHCDHYGAQYVSNLLRERFHVVGGSRTIKYYCT